MPNKLVGRSRFSAGMSSFFAFSLAIVASFAIAQDDEAAYVRHVTATVKPDRVAQFENLLRDRAVALEAAGDQAYRHVYEYLSGTLYTYLVVDPLPTLAVRDRPPAVPVPPELSEGVRDTVMSRESMTLLTYPDLSIPLATGEERGLARLRLRRNIPARTRPYYLWQAEELVPAQREAGLKWLYTGRVIVGGSVQDWISLAHIDSWESLEGNILANTTTPQERGQMFSRGSGNLAYGEDIVVRYRPDLSFVLDE